MSVSVFEILTSIPQAKVDFISDDNSIDFDFDPSHTNFVNFRTDIVILDATVKGTVELRLICKKKLSDIVLADKRWNFYSNDFKQKS